MRGMLFSIAIVWGIGGVIWLISAIISGNMWDIVISLLSIAICGMATLLGISAD